MSALDENGGSSSRDYRVFSIQLFLYGIVLLPILRANRYYNDDLKRALIGRTGWDATGRPLTNLLMRALQCYDHATVDISPATQIGAIVVLSWIGVLIARRFAIRSAFTAALVTFPLGGQPFFLENLSYKFDALSMSLALLFALLPVIGIERTRRGWWLGVLALFASLNLYQAAINACLIFILLEFVLSELEDAPPRDCIRALGVRLVQAAVAMAAYELIVGIHINGWVKRKSQTIHDIQHWGQIGRNIADFSDFVGSSFNAHWWQYFAPVLVVLGLCPIVVGVRYAMHWRRSQPIWRFAMLLVGNMLVPVVALLFVLGPMLVLSAPPVVPRVLLGIGALLASALVIARAAFERWNLSAKWVISVSAFMAIGFCCIASAYGNAMAEQKAYEERIAAGLADDLAALGAPRSMRTILLIGEAGYSPITAHICEQFPIVGQLVPTYIAEDDTFHTHIFLRYFLPEFVDLRLMTDGASQARASDLRQKIAALVPVRVTAAYSLYVTDDVAVVAFRPAAPISCSGA